MELKKLIGKGYLPKELPPIFTSEMLSDNIDDIYNEISSHTKCFQQIYNESNSVSYNIPKIGLSRRLLGIPNPYHQILLSKAIVDNWNEIEKILDSSNISCSKPVDDTNGRSVKTEYNYNDFREKCIKASFNKKYELKTDISKYYPTIYTHSIPWAIHTKDIAKQNRNNFQLIGNILDKALRQGQSGQTKGIPIGPDTSMIISEILGCTFDKLLSDGNDIIGFRYVDDCYFYFDSLAEAEKAFKDFQMILNKYSLDINEEKTQIKETKLPFEKKWAIELTNYKINKNIKKQRKDLTYFVSLALELSLEYPKESVIKFAVKKLSYTKICYENWDLFETLIYKMTLAEPAVLPDLLSILLSYEKLVDSIKLHSFIDVILEDSIRRNHNFEISWALWISYSFRIRINGHRIKDIINSNDVVSILILLYYSKEMKIDLNNCDLDTIKSELKADNLKTDLWLLVYQITVDKLIENIDYSFINNSPFFNYLMGKSVNFIDLKKQVKNFIFGEEMAYDTSNKIFIEEDY